MRVMCIAQKTNVRDTIDMEQELVLQTNLFFYVTSVAVIVVTAFVIIALYLLIRILKNIKDITDTAREGIDSLICGVGEIREFIGNIHKNIIPFISLFVRGVAKEKQTSPKKRKTAKKQEDGE